MQAPRIPAAPTGRASIPAPLDRPPPGQAGRLWPFLIAAALVSVPLVVQTVQTRWSTDAWLHAASILELSEHPFDPGHPTVASAAGDPELSPYALLWGVVHRATGAPVLTIMTVAGIVNLAALWSGLWMLATRLTRARLAPAFSVLAVLLVWGFGPWRWSGYPNLNSLGYGLPYPSFAALAGYLVAVALFLDWRRDPRWSRAWAIAVLGALVTLVHPITGAALALALGTLLVVGARGNRPPGRVMLTQLALPAIVAVIIVVAWPLYSFTALFENAGSYTDANARVLRQVVPRAALGLACLPVAVVMGRRRDDWRLVALALPPLVLVATGVALDTPVLGRFMPFGLLPLQIAVADAVAGAVPRGAILRGPRLATGAALALLGLFGTASAIPSMVPEPLLPSRLRTDDRIASIRDEAIAIDGVHGDVVVIAPQNSVARALLTSGAKLVNPLYATPELDDVDSRTEAVTGFLEASPDRRQQIIEEYGVTYLVLTDRAAAQVDLAVFGDSARRVDGLVVVRLDAPGGDDPQVP